MRILKKKRNIEVSDLVQCGNTYYPKLYIELTGKDGVKYLLQQGSLVYNFKTKVYCYGFYRVHNCFNVLNKNEETGVTIREIEENIHRYNGDIGRLLKNEKMSDYEEVFTFDDFDFGSNFTFTDEQLESIAIKDEDVINYMSKQEFRNERKLSFSSLAVYNSSETNSNITERTFTNSIFQSVLQRTGYRYNEVRLLYKIEGLDLFETYTFLLDRTTFSCGVCQIDGLYNFHDVEILKNMFEISHKLTGIETFICSTTTYSTTLLYELLQKDDSLEHVSLCSYNNNSGNDIDTFIVRLLNIEYDDEEYCEFDDDDDF